MCSSTSRDQHLVAWKAAETLDAGWISGMQTITKQPWNMAWRLVCVFQSPFLVKLEIPSSAFTTLMAFIYLWSWKSIHSPVKLPGPCPAATPKTTTRQRSRVQCQCRRCRCRVGGAVVRTYRTWPWKMLGTSEPCGLFTRKPADIMEKS